MPLSEAVPLIPVVSVVVGAVVEFDVEPVVGSVVVVASVLEALDVSSPLQPRGIEPRERRNARCR